MYIYKVLTGIMYVSCKCKCGLYLTTHDMYVLVCFHVLIREIIDEIEFKQKYHWPVLGFSFAIELQMVCDNYETNVSSLQAPIDKIYSKTPLEQSCYSKCTKQMCRPLESVCVENRKQKT